jgi:Transposase
LSERACGFESHTRHRLEGLSVRVGIMWTVGHIRSPDVVESALSASDAGVPDAENARRHGVAVATIRRWRRLYQRRGQSRGHAHLTVTCPRCDGVDLDPEAYAELLGWYLGDGHISRGRHDVFALHIFNDLKYPEPNAHVSALMRRVKPGDRPHTPGPGGV